MPLCIGHGNLNAIFLETRPHPCRVGWYSSAYVRFLNVYLICLNWYEFYVLLINQLMARWRFPILFLFKSVAIPIFLCKLCRYLFLFVRYYVERFLLLCDVKKLEKPLTHFFSDFIPWRSLDYPSVHQECTP